MDKNLFNDNYLLFYFYHEFVLLLSFKLIINSNFHKKKKQFETLFKIKEVC